MPRVLGQAPARHRRGNAAFTSVSIMAMLGFGALTIDIGHARMVRAQLQNAADAAAHAAILDLDGTDLGIEAGRSAALYIASLNTADRDPVLLANADVVFGQYDADAKTFTPTEDPLVVNAVVVTHQKLDIDAIFGLAAFGVEQLGAGVSAMAVLPPVTPATAVSCYLPLAVPKCAVSTGIFDFRASSNPADTAGWAALPGADGQKPNASFLKQQLSGTNCQPAVVGDTATTMNGSATSAAMTAFKRINYGEDHYDGTNVGPWNAGGLTYQPPAEWPTDEWPVQPAASERIPGSSIDSGSFGRYGIAGPVMLVTKDADGDGEDDFCDDDNGDGLPDNPPNWTGEMQLDGFAFGMIYDGKSGVVRIRLNTEFDFSSYATEGGGDSPVGLVYQDPPRMIPPP